MIAMTHLNFRRVVLAVFAAAIAAVAVAFASERARSAAVSYGGIERGEPAALSSSSRKLLEGMPGGPPALASRVRVVSGTAFYRLQSATGVCFARGPADASEAAFTFVACPRDFPSMPLLDFSTFEASRGSTRARVVRFEGLAADNVAAVALLDADGGEMAHVSVVRNVYAGAVAGHSREVAALVALDRDNKIVYRLNLVR